MSNRYFADVSNNNSQNIDFNKYRNQGGHLLVGLKATEGITFVDATHAHRSAAAHRAGCWVAHYHFGHPGESPSAQAAAFWAQAGPHFTGKDFAVIDIEIGDPARRTPRFMEEMDQMKLPLGMVGHWVRSFDSAFRDISGHTLVGYSGESFLHQMGAAGIKRWWVAKYGPPPVHTPVGADQWAWQFTDGAVGPPPHSCAGIGTCDVSTLNSLTYFRLRIAKRPS